MASSVGAEDTLFAVTGNDRQPRRPGPTETTEKSQKISVISVFDIVVA
jgi:hypothetical protein